MAKELPYFKYFPSEWVTGDITLMSMEAQGLFINICCFYWMRNCSICLANVKQRFSKHEATIQALLKQNIIKLDEDENIVIEFLDEQMNEFINVSKKRAMAGAKGGKANAKQVLSKAKAKSSNKDKDKDKEKIREDNINIPSFDNFKNYVLEKEPNININALKIKYEAWKENNWKDGKDKKIQNWKSKILQTIQYIEKNVSNNSPSINDKWKT